MRGLLVAAIWLSAAPVLAQPRSLDEALSVPEGASCLTHEALVEHTESWLGTYRLDARQTILIELGQDERFDVGFVLLDGEEPRARRSFARLPEACADRRAALSLALAIALDTSVLDRLGGPRGAHTDSPSATPPEPEISPEPSPAVAEAPPVSELPAPEVRGESAWGVSIGLDAGLGVGLLSRLTPWGGVDVALRGRGWKLRALAGGTPRLGSPLAGARVRTQLVVGGLDACLDRDVGSVEWAGCLGPRLGRLSAEGQGFAVSESTQLWWAALSAGLSMRWPRESVLSLRLGLAGQLGLVRPELFVTDMSGARTHGESLAPVGFTAVLGVVASMR